MLGQAADVGASMWATWPPHVWMWRQLRHR